MNLDVIIFIGSAVVAVFAATMMITQRNAVASVMYMILSLLAQAVCYIQLGALFLGAILVIVYAGAILVLFLFVIMLLNLRGTEDLGETPPAISRFAKYSFGVLVTLELVMIVKGAPLQAVATGVMGVPPEDFGAVATVARLMFTEFLYPFELTGVLLLVAVIGAVVIARKGREDEQSLPAPGAAGSADKPQADKPETTVT